MSDEKAEMRAVLRSQELTDEKNRKMAARLRRERDAAQSQVADLLAALERVESILRPIATDNPVYERTTAHFDAHGIARAAIAKGQGR